MIYAEQSEQALLTCLFIDTNLFYKISDLVFADDFYFPKNKIIFEVFSEMLKANKKIDIQTFNQELVNQGKEQQIGGISYISSLLQHYPTLSHIVEYAKIIQNKSFG